MKASLLLIVALALVFGGCSDKKRTEQQQAIDRKAGTTAQQREFVAKMAEQAAAYYQNRRAKERAAKDEYVAEVDVAAAVSAMRPLLEAMATGGAVTEPCAARHLSQPKLTVVQREIVDVLLARAPNAFPELLYNELNSPPVLGLKRVVGGKAMHGIRRSHIETAQQAFSDPAVGLFEASELSPAKLDISKLPVVRVAQRAKVTGTLTLFRTADATPLCAVKVAASVRAEEVPTGAWTEWTAEQWERNDLAQTFWDGVRRALAKAGVVVELRSSPDNPPDVSREPS